MKDKNLNPFLVSQALLILFFICSLSIQGEATDSLRSLLTTCRKSDRSRILNDLAGKVLEEKPEEAVIYATEALKFARDYNLDNEEARALYLLAESAVTMGNHAEAIGYYQQSAEIEKQTAGAGSENYANRIGDIGYAYYTMDQPLRAMPFLQQSLQISISRGYDTQAASMYSNIGAIYTEWGDYDKALVNNQLALVIDRRVGEPEQISTDLNNIGKIYEQWGKYDLAVKYYLDALDIAKKAGNQQMIAVRLNNLGIVYKAWKRYPEALRYFNEALAIDRETGNTDKVGKRLAYIGATYLSMGNPDQCLFFLNQALPIIRKSGLQDEEARLYNIYGKYYLSVKNYPKAVESFNISQEYTASNNLKPLRMGNFNGLAEAYEKSGKPMQALQALRKYLEIKDSVFTAESDLKLTEFQARFENEKMKLENEILLKESHQKNKIFLLSGILGLSLVVILLAIIFILRLRSRNSLQAKEIAEKDANRFRDDLETRNRELAFQAMSIIKNNETISSIVEGLDKSLKNGSAEEELNLALNQVRHLEKDKGWKDFEIHFTRVNSEFYQKLNQRFPDLTPNERKLCAFLRLNMTTKDIASITHQSLHSINVARTRLRRKMNLANSEENLVTFLINL